jgi:DNA-binding HxlR family transcriptional regulator
MKGKRTDLGDKPCGISRALQVVGDWWSLLIVRDAFHGHQRFGEFQKSLGLAKNILSARLKKLVDDGVFRVERDSASSSIHRYVLTEKGEKLSTILVALWQWGEDNCFEPGELPYEMVDARDREPLARIRLTAKDGRVLGPREFRTIEIPRERRRKRPAQMPPH